MARPLIAGIAPGIVLAPDYIVRVTALDATTGAVVSGVIVSNVSLQVDQANAEPDTLPVPPVGVLLGYVPQDGADVAA